MTSKYCENDLRNHMEESVFGSLSRYCNVIRLQVLAAQHELRQAFKPENTHRNVFGAGLKKCVFCDTDEVKSVSVMEEDSVTLHTDITKIQKNYVILWRFGLQKSLIARINGATSVFCDTDEVKSVSVVEEDSVTLYTHLTKIQKNDVILWRFGLQKSLIAKINRATSEISIYADVLDGRFRDRLQVNNQTGDLIITDTKTKDSGLYEMIINSAKESSYKFNVTVYAFLPVPVITRDSSQCSSSSSSSNCSLLCSVLNVRDVSLSWYKGKSLLSSISVTYLNIRLSLPLEVEYQDTNTFRCVVNNAIKNRTQHLNITQLCQTCSDCVCCCHDFEAVIRLVVSALVGVATVAILIYDIRSSRVEQKKRSQTPSDYK
ncbi:uncharacterized protein [Misgurnus anguillicaudatus]|uniref:uncharacterized protein n=1 Tax=Misgurnus anguillicaudatus TaxID=75329 RepID=UPI003CCEFE83